MEKTKKERTETTRYLRIDLRKNDILELLIERGVIKAMDAEGATVFMHIADKNNEARAELDNVEGDVFQVELIKKHQTGDEIPGYAKDA
jgi:hypothetical protein